MRIKEGGMKMERSRSFGVFFWVEEWVLERSLRVVLDYYARTGV